MTLNHGVAFNLPRFLIHLVTLHEFGSVLHIIQLKIEYFLKVESAAIFQHSAQVLLRY